MNDKWRIKKGRPIKLQLSPYYKGQEEKLKKEYGIPIEIINEIEPDPFFWNLVYEKKFFKPFDIKAGMCA